MRFRLALSNAVDWAAGFAALRRSADSVTYELAELVAERARAYAPVDTGRLRDSIQIQDGYDTASGGALVRTVVATAPYALPVEMGHFTRGGAFVPPNPFLRRALADGRAAFPAAAARARLQGPGRTVSAAAAPMEGAPRNVTFASAGDMAAETGVGSFSGGSGPPGVRVGP